MLVHEIMTPQPITVRADTTIVEAANTMLLHHIGALPVVDETGTLIGIISEGDFIRRAEIGTQRKRGRWLTCLVGKDQIAAEFVHEHGRAVGEIMTPDPLTVTEDTPLDRIVQIMQYNNIKRLPVVRGNQLVGIVGHSDFLQAVADLAHDVACPPASDDRTIRTAVITAIEHNVWRPTRLKVIVRDGIVRLSGIVRSECIRQAVIVAAENVAGVKQVHDHLRKAEVYPPPEEDLGGGDFVSLQEHPSTTDDQPL